MIGFGLGIALEISVEQDTGREQDIIRLLHD